MVIPLRDCIARPSKPGQPDLLLVDHLEAVAEWCGDAQGSFDDRLAFLAGLSHDAAKATQDWQIYIRGDPQRKKGPPHAPTGAALFAFWAEQLIPRWTSARDEQKRLHDLAIDWARVVDHHHGALDDLADTPPWEQSSTRLEHEPAALLATCDQEGLDALVRKHFPELKTSLKDFETWCMGHDRVWGYRQGSVRGAICAQSEREVLDRLGLRIAELGARLIYADRRHAADRKPVSLASAQGETALRRFDEHCRAEAEKTRTEGVSEELLRARQQKQSEALAAYQACVESHFLTLLLPTGYGKTLAGLRVALEAIRAGRCRRILYVAPYISILSQSARVLEQATGFPVVLHHQMSILSLADAGQPAKTPGDDVQREDHQPYDLLDTWQAPIVATTFNQLFRALFPARAQQCLRIPALDRAFVFIDEPQIINPAVWSAFLRAMAVVAGQRGAQVLFCTATLPPLDEGLGDRGPARSLTEHVHPAVNRFTVRSVPEPWNADRVVDEAERRLRTLGSAAVILNTVRDAVTVFRKLRARGGRWFFLASRMLPGHKEQIIRQIRKSLKNKAKPTGVVCTQVLEAGVDLSFRAILRALPIFPSVIQSAGRGNRHGEGGPAEVLVFRFLRDDGADLRPFVYRDRDAIRITDEIFAQAPMIPETDVAHWLSWYYARCWEANPHLKSLEYFEAAARGQWSKLAGNEPFQEDRPGLDVFIPGSERYLPSRYRRLLAKFGVDTARQLLDRYLDAGARRQLQFRERRLQSALLRQFLVDVPSKHAVQIAHPVEGFAWPLVIDNPRHYRASTGLAGELAEDDSNGGTQVC